MSTSDFSAFALFTAGLAILAPVVSAQITVPGGSSPSGGAVFAPDSTSAVTAGTPFNIQWKNSTDDCGDKVDLVLLYGPSPSQMNALSYIVQGTDNSGSYSWTPSTSLTASDDTNKYGIERICVQTKGYQYTVRFQIANDKKPTSSSASASASGSSSAASSSSAEPKYPTGNSTTVAGTTGAATTTGGLTTTTATSSGSGHKTSSAGSSSKTGSATSSSASATSTGNAAEHLKAGFGGLLAAAAVAALAL